MADALNQNLDLATALAGFATTLFGRAPTKTTETEGEQTTTKTTSLSTDAMNQLIRNMTEGGLSGNATTQGVNGPIAGLAAIMSGQKSAGLYNSEVTTQLMNKNMANIAGTAALAAAPVTTTTTPKTTTKEVKQPGILSTPAGKAGLLLAGMTALKSKKFREMTGIDSLLSDNVDTSAKNAVDWGGGNSTDYSSPNVSPSSEPISDAGSVNISPEQAFLDTTQFTDLASQPGNFDVASLDTGTVTDVSSGVVDAVPGLTDAFTSSDVASGFVSDFGEVGSTIADSASSGGGGIMDFFSSIGDWFGFKSGGYVSANLLDDPKKITTPAVTPTATTISPTATKPVVAPVAPIVSTSKKKAVDPDMAMLAAFANDISGGAPGTGIGTSSDSEGTGVATGISGLSTGISGAISGLVGMIGAVVAAQEQGVNPDSVTAADNAANESGDNPAGVTEGTATVGVGTTSSADSSAPAGDSAGPAGDGTGGAVGSDGGSTGATGTGDGSGSTGGDGGGSGAGDGGGGWSIGGEIDGPGTGTSDSINIRVSDGEYVIPALAVRKLGGPAVFDRLLADMNMPVPRHRRVA